MNNTKRMTIKYWNTLSKDSKKRALMQCFGAQPSLVKIMLNDEPDTNRACWKIAFSTIKQTDDKFYKTSVNGWLLP